MPEVEVDMLSSARDAQFDPLTFLGPGYKKVLAPAKVNLFLGVGSVLPSGYHEVTNVMHAITLHDVLYVHLEDHIEEENAPSHRGWAGHDRALAVDITISDKTTHFGEKPLEIETEQNLCFKAVDQLARALERTESAHISIHIEKNIPAQAGLGGGSSDAAAVLVCLAQLWGLSPSDEMLVQVAASLGADVAFFLQGGCALYGGAGEVFEHALEPAKTPIVIVKPEAGVSTARAYAAFDVDPAFPSSALVAEVEKAMQASHVPLFNNLAKASESIVPDLSIVREWLVAQPEITDPNQVLLCGSGAATFAFANSFEEASRIATRAKQQGWWARPAALSSLRAAVVG